MRYNKPILFKPQEPYILTSELDSSIEKCITGNLLAKNKEGDSFQYVSWNYFLDNPSFGNKLKDFDVEFVNEFNFQYKVLCYNRRPHPHRKILMYNILNDSVLKDNTLFSLGYDFDYNQRTDTKVIHSYINDLELSENIFQYFSAINTHIGFDTDIDLGVADIDTALIKLEDYRKTFVSLVTETNVNQDILFFSEKTYKPIAAQHPFIILGNPNSLKYLKSIGFKTFDKWWDESYDEELDFKIRLEKILDIVKKICTMSYSELYSIRKEMNDVCIYNYKHFLKSTGITSELKKLGFESKTFPIIRNKLI
jgi:hypothetical protein